MKQENLLSVSIRFILLTSGIVPITTFANSDATETKQLATINVQAQESENSHYIIDPQTSTLHSDSPINEVPQTVNVLSNQYLKDYQPQNLDDALRNVSGITQGNTLAGTQDTVMKRGFGDNRDGSIMVNGMPIVQGRVLNNSVQSIEVLKGPASLLYGIMDPGGVINAVTKTPKKQQQTEISVFGSTFGDTKNGSGIGLDTTGPIGQSHFAYRFIAEHSNEDYWRNFGTYKQTLIAPSIAWDNGETKVNLSYQYRDFLTPFDRGTIIDPTTNKPLAVPKTERLDEPFNEMDGRSHLAQLMIDHELNDQWKLHAGYSYNRETYDAEQLRIMKIDPKTHTLTRRSDATHDSISLDSYAQIYVNGHFNLFGFKNDLQFGVDSEYRKYLRKDLLRAKNTTNSFDYLNPDYGQEKPSNNISAADSGQTDKLHAQGVYFQDSFHINEQWIAVLGARYQQYQQTAGKGRPLKVNTNTDDSAFLPRAGLVYKYDNNLSLYASYTESLKPSSTIAPLDGSIVIDNAFNPESAKSYEIGAKYQIADRFNANFAIYDIEKKNVLVGTFNPVTSMNDWRTSGQARSRGAEIDLSGRITENLDAMASYAYTDAKTTEDPVYTGKKLINVAKNTASLSLTYDFGEIIGGHFRFGGSSNYIGKRAGDSANSFELPSYTLANLFAVYDTKIAKQDVSFQFNLNNVFDKNYYTSSVNNLMVAMGNSRQAVLKATLKF